MFPSMESVGTSVAVELDGARAVWFRMPATTQDPHRSTTRPHTIGVSFTGHRDAIVERPAGRRERMEVRPNALFVTCDEPFDWVHVAEPYEGVEFEITEALNAEIADATGVALDKAVGSFVLDPDPVFWAASIRLRQHATGARALGDLEGDELLRAAMTHVACEYYGGRPSRQNARPLDGRRLNRVVEHVDAHMGGRLSVSDLAASASMSTSHFHEAFRRATGLTPHEFVTARRVEHARALLASGWTREEAASEVGYTAGHAFRRALQRFGGP